MCYNRYISGVIVTELLEISENIYRIPASESPLSADVGVIRGESGFWIYDIGSIKENADYINRLGAPVRAVLSHFHRDHIGALQYLNAERIFLSANTYKYAGRGETVKGDLYLSDGIELHIFELPSSHSKGSLGLEAGGFAFLGDGVYSLEKGGRAVYNATLLKDCIEKLKTLGAEKFLLSHEPKFVFSKDEVIGGLERIYSKRIKNEAYIEA